MRVVNSIAVEVTPSAIRIAKLMRRNHQLSITALAEKSMPYDSFEKLYRHPDTCAEVLNTLCRQLGIQHGSCIAAVPAVRAKTQSVALALMKARALRQILSNANFWRKHLRTDSTAYGYAYLVTVCDVLQHRLSLWLMASPLTDIIFYKSVFAHTRLSLQALTLSSLDYFCVARYRLASFRMVVITPYEAYLTYFDEHTFLRHSLLPQEDSHLILSEQTATDKLTVALANLARAIQEYTCTDSRNLSTINIAMSVEQPLLVQRVQQLQALLTTIELKPFDVCEGIEVAEHLTRPTARMHHVIALAHWPWVNPVVKQRGALTRHSASFIRNDSPTYYQVAICWGAAIFISLLLLLGYQQLAHHWHTLAPQFEYQEQLANQHTVISQELSLLKKQIEDNKNRLKVLNTFSQQQRLAINFLTHLSQLLADTLAIESLDCQWLDACYIKGRAHTYSDVVVFSEALKKIEGVAEVIITQAQSQPNTHQAAMEFALECQLNSWVLDD